MKKLLYLDIDGVVLPYRAYLLPNQTEPVVSVFDPCAVSMLNEICKETGAKIVLHSSWIQSSFWKVGKPGAWSGDVHHHCIEQGILSEHFFHEDIYCERSTYASRVDRIRWHINKHKPEMYYVFDDEDMTKWFGENFYLCDFDEGINCNHLKSLCGDPNSKTGWQL